MTAVVRMTHEEFDALGESRDEYIDGALIVNPHPRKSHQQVSRRIANLLNETVPHGYEAVEAWSWKRGDDEFIPDVLLVAETDEDVRYTGIPELAVEVLSSDRAADLVVKAHKYAEAGLPRFWVVDVPARALTVFTLVNDRFERQALVVGEDHAEVDLGPCRISVSPTALIDS